MKSVRFDSASQIVCFKYLLYRVTFYLHSYFIIARYPRHLWLWKLCCEQVRTALHQPGQWAATVFLQPCKSELQLGYIKSNWPSTVAKSHTLMYPRALSFLRWVQPETFKEMLMLWASGSLSGRTDSHDCFQMYFECSYRCRYALLWLEGKNRFNFNTRS